VRPSTSQKADRTDAPGATALGRRRGRRVAWSRRRGGLALGLLATVLVALAGSALPAAADLTPGSLSGQSYQYPGGTTGGWPVAPINEQHPIRGSFLDPRPGEVSTGGDPGYHIGIDINVRDDQPEAGHPTNRTHKVYAIEGGTASIPSNQADVTCSNRKVTIGQFEYWHTDTVPVISDGQQISPGQFIGWTCYPMWHVHLSEDMLVNYQWMYVNPLHGAGGPTGPTNLQPYSDDLPPEIKGIRFYTPAMPTWSVVNNAVTSPDAGTELFPVDQGHGLHGYVDVRALIDDPQSFKGWFGTDHPELYAPLHPYRVRLTVTRLSPSPTTVVLARDVFRADGILDSAAATLPIPIDYHYAPGTEQNLPAVDCENLHTSTSADCTGQYWLRLFATPIDAYWNTKQLDAKQQPLYPDGQYQIDVTAWDTLDHYASSSATAWITNAGVAPSPDFAITASPASQTVRRGRSTSYSLAISPSGGFSGSVKLAVNGLPAGVSGSFSSNPATTSSTLTVKTARSATTGSYAFTVTGISGGLTHTTSPVSLVISN
jgi:hypothetical protein